MTFRFRTVHALGALYLIAACTFTEYPEGPGTGTGGTAGGTPTTGGGAGMSTGGTAGSVASTGGTAGTASPAGGAPAGGTAPIAGDGGTPAVTAGSSGMATSGGAPAAGSGGAPAAGTAGTDAAGTGGTLAGTAGTAGTAATGGSAGAPAAMPCPDGCAELSVPFTAYETSQYFEIYLDADTDLTGAVVTVRARKVAGKAGGLQIFAKNGEAQNYAFIYSSWSSINDMTSEWASFTLDIATPGGMGEEAFVPTAARILAVQVNAGDPWYTDETETTIDPTALVNPTVIQVDEISITGSGTYPPPWPFTSAATPLTANLSEAAVMAMPPYAVPGSTVTWVGP